MNNAVLTEQVKVAYVPGAERPWVVDHKGNFQYFASREKRDEYAAWIIGLEAKLAAKAVTNG